MTTVTVDRAVLEQALEACEQRLPLVGQATIIDELNALRAALAQEQAEPEQEPVAWIYQNAYTEQEYLVWKKGTGGRNWRPLYTAPPRRTMVPLTEQEILAAVGWERAEMYMKLTPNFPADEAKKETLKNARAIEKASWEKNHDPR